LASSSASISGVFSRVSIMMRSSESLSAPLSPDLPLLSGRFLGLLVTLILFFVPFVLLDDSRFEALASSGEFELLAGSEYARGIIFELPDL